MSGDIRQWQFPKNEADKVVGWSSDGKRLVNRDVNDLVTSGMEAATYDPQGVEDDAFDRTNHTGAQAISTVTGLQTALDGKAATSHTHAISDVTNLQTTLDGKATAAQGAKADTALQAASTITDAISGMILVPANKDYRLVVKVPFAGTITETVTRSASGTCTATFKVNTTALGGTANSVSSTEQAQAHASSNTFAADDDLVLTVSSNSACADMSFTIKFTRALS